MTNSSEFAVIVIVIVFIQVCYDHQNTDNHWPTFLHFTNARPLNKSFSL